MNCGQSRITKDVVFGERFVCQVLDAVRDYIAEWFVGYNYDLLRTDDMTWGIYDGGVILGSFSISKVRG
jgi:hypothetical protein